MERVDFAREAKIYRSISFIEALFGVFVLISGVPIIFFILAISSNIGRYAINIYK